MTKFTQKGYFWSETEKVNIQFHWILDIRISLGTKFQLKLAILKFGTKFFQKWYFKVDTGENKHHHWILHIRIRIATKSHLQVTVFIFGPNLLKKGISGLKQKNHSVPMVVTYYIKRFCTVADGQNGILMPLLLLFAKTMR